ncbi:MAG: DUF190 domain-containing protein [Spirochaetaceae bacterium]|nr:DUF190 domain-containing protein [Spirochaetaceae bacterium]
MKNIIAIALGGSLGAVSRYLLSKYVSGYFGAIFPWGTLAVNLIGSLLIGFLFGLAEKTIIPASIRTFVMIGFIGESDHCKGKALYEQIVLKARELNLAGATVLRGIMGFGADSRMHSAKILNLSMDLPIIIEIVDTQEKIDLILPFIDEHVVEGLVTIENISVIKYRHS